MSLSRYRIRLEITHAYAAGAAAGLHDLRVLPARLPERQSVVWSRLETDPSASERSRRVDFFGNAVTRVAVPGSHGQLRVTMEALVQFLAPEPTLDIAPPLPVLREEIAGLTDLGAASPLHMLGPSARVPADAAMADYGEKCLYGSPSALRAVQTIGTALHRDMTFDSTATSVDTPVREAFAARRGVCQDFSHVMIACLRGVGIPASYVSGFLRTIPPPGQPRLAGADAMHAWVRAWCGLETGWVEFDPTNGVLAGKDHIVVGYGRDYDDVSPIRGVLRAAGPQTSRQAVDVVPVTADGLQSAEVRV